MCRAAPISLLLIALAGQGQAVASPPDGADGARLAGKRIYLDGVLPSGEPVRATVQKNVGLSGADAACAKCHRRSGLGSSEGSNNIRPIAGRLLFAQPETARPVETGGGVAAGARVAERPAYTEASLARALRDGIDPAGHTLNPLMPRYPLSDADIAVLYAYLDALSSEPAPGVSDTAIHFSTIIAPGVSPEKTRAMLEVLQAFVSDKNGGTRKETRRREIGREQMYRAYRTWILHTWELTGPADGWGEQLAHYYRQQPVFAVIGGIGGASWQPVHEFCEVFEVPCVFPDVDYPDVTGTGYYPLYFSRGVTLEAEVLARHLLDSDPSRKPGTIVQVYRDNALGRLPAQVLRDYLRGKSGKTIIDYPLADPTHMPADLLATLDRNERPSLLISWLNSAELETLVLNVAPPAGLAEIFVSASLSDLRRPALTEHWLSKLRMVYPFDLPTSFDQRLSRMKAWLRARKIPLSDERTQANAFFAASVTGDAVSHLGENFSRDYFIERIEQMTETALSPSIYPHLSLGPGQRFASKGGYVVGFPPGMEGVPVAIGKWQIP